MPAGDLDPLQLSWDALPPSGNDIAKMAQILEKRTEQLKIDMKELKTEMNARNNKLASELLALKSQIVPTIDPVALRCLVDTFLNMQGFTAQSGPRQTWIKGNKKRLSRASGIPEARIEVFLQKFWGLADDITHTFKSDGIAQAITRITDDNDNQADFKALFKSLFGHSVEYELGEKYVYAARVDGEGGRAWKTLEDNPHTLTARVVRL